MEPEGAVEIFKRSVEDNGLLYVQYIGGGDSSAFQTVVKSNPYPGKVIRKLECVGHIQKRVGSRLRKLKEKHKDRKGEGKLTDKIINTLQNYYGMAIRNNTGNVEHCSDGFLHCKNLVLDMCHLTLTYVYCLKS